MNARVDARALPNDRLRAASDWLVRLHEERVSEAEIAEWIQWCESDPDNLAAFEAVEGAWKGLGELPETVQSRLAARIASPTQSRVVPTFLQRLPWVPLAAAATVLLVAGAIGLAVVHHADDQPPPLVANAIETAPAKNAEAMLPDGSLVALGAKSALKVDFADNERRLRMGDGQAFFKVNPDKRRPFVVEVGPIEITAVGTAFDVRKNEGRVVVSVTEGTVEVATTDMATRSEIARETRLQVLAGYQLTWGEGGRQVKLVATDPNSASGWRSGRLEYLAEPLWAVISNVNRYSHRNISIADESISELQFTGTVFVGAIDDWITMLPRAFPVTCERQADGSVIVRRRVSLEDSAPSGS